MVKHPLPPGLDWEVWRVFAAPNYTVSLVELHTQWTIDDVAEAHEYLDLLEDLEILKANALNT